MDEFDLKTFYKNKREYLNPKTGKLRKGFVKQLSGVFGLDC